MKSRYFSGFRPDSVKSCSECCTCFLQLEQIMRTRRWARMQLSADTKLYGSTPMFRNRPRTSTTLFAWTVVKTRCPVSADYIVDALDRVLKMRAEHYTV